MRRDSADAVTLIQRLSEGKSGAPVLVAIDGHSAAGKSTLARTLQRRLEAQLVSGDDFYGVMDEAERFSLDAEAGYRRYYDHERLAAEVLEPLSNRQTARYRAYDWMTGALGDYRETAPHGTILVEGVYVARPELRRYYDVCVLVETPERVREGRQQARADASKAWLERWEDAERYYFEFVFGSADLIVPTE